MTPSARVDLTAGEGCLVVRWDPIGDHHVDVGTGPTPDPSEHTHVMRVPSRVGSARLAPAPGGRAYASVSWPGTTVVAAERRFTLLDDQYGGIEPYLRGPAG